MTVPQFNDPVGINRDFVPAMLLDLPFNLRRAHYYPSRPRIPQEGVMQIWNQGFTPPPKYMPQKMGFRRWKTPPFPTDFVSASSSAMRAVFNTNREPTRLTVSRASNTGKPIASMREAAQMLDAQRLPQPSDNLIMDRPLARGLNPRHRQLPPYDLNLIGRQQAQVRTDTQISRTLAREQAREEAQMLRRGFLGLVGGFGQDPNANVTEVEQGMETGGDVVTVTEPSAVAGRNYWAWGAAAAGVGLLFWFSVELIRRT